MPRIIADKPTADDHKACQQFWQIAIQKLLDKVAQPDATNSALQSNACDALSNISAQIFERLQVGTHRTQPTSIRITHPLNSNVARCTSNDFWCAL